MTGPADLPAPRRLLVVGFRRWRRGSFLPLLRGIAANVLFAPTPEAAARLAPTPDDALLCWNLPPWLPALQALATRHGTPLLRMEDGFLRSVGLGSDLVRPQSIVLDSRGLYVDPSGPSDLTQLLETAEFTAELCAQAARLRQRIVATGLTKYNHEPVTVAGASWRTAAAGRRVVLVPGQVENDASVRLGGGLLQTNAELLRAVRMARPDAFIVYKPHPDGLAGNRPGRLSRVASPAAGGPDAVAPDVPLVTALASADEVHTLTSLTGFDALLRGMPVVTYGQPFYAGWGLTEDRAPRVHRARPLSLDALTAGVLLRYAHYWDWTRNNWCSAELTLERLLAERETFVPGGRLRRWARKARTLATAERHLWGRKIT